MPQFLWEHLKETSKPILIYGMGDGCDKILRVCQQKGISVQGIFASDEYVRGQAVHGFRVMRYGEARAIFGDFIALLAFGVFRDDLMEKIQKINSEVEFYAPEVPLFGGGLFDRAYYERYHRDIRYARSLLSDEKSKEVFDCLLDYKISGRIEPLIRCQSCRCEDIKALIPFRDSDVYLDLGAYDGDTAEEWDALFHHHGEIVAVEPNPKTYRKLKEKEANIPRLRAVEAAVWYRNEPLTFNSKTGRAAAVDQHGPIEVQGLRADELCPEARVIKYDVEGVEQQAISGSARVILKNTPALIVSAYHRTEDFFTLPVLVRAMNRGYRVYLRHAPYVPAWDTLYFFVKE